MSENERIHCIQTGCLCVMRYIRAHRLKAAAAAAAPALLDKHNDFHANVYFTRQQSQQQQMALPIHHATHWKSTAKNETLMYYTSPFRRVRARRLTPSPRSSVRISARIINVCMHGMYFRCLLTYAQFVRDTQTGDTLNTASHLHKLYSAHIMSAHRDVHNKNPQRSLMWRARVCVRARDTVSNENFNSFKVVSRLLFTPARSQKPAPKKCPLY